MSVQPTAHHSCPHGFTLLELLIAISILGIVLTTIYAAYSGVLTNIRELGDDSRVYQMARVTLDRMSRDLTSLQRSKGAFVLQSEDGSIGVRSFEAITFWSAAHLVFDEGEVSGSPAAIGYYVREDKNGGFSLWRSDVARAKPDLKEKAEGGIILCRDLQALNFKFYNESGDEQDSWDTESSSESQKGRPPAVIQIELLLANGRDTDKPYRFATKVFIPVRK
ncbi:MAG: prepilin-type N-terminal cleavage/methylation domain-containing protein [Smithellaceae bacterium]|jgi:general secretion pathway protein J|nr:prepilin-type N-terminal cleavage/methylation domain-containing protein [Smithellaceae bacterium]